MPLIIITGTPCSGKTFRAQQILKQFEARIKDSHSGSKQSVVHLPSQHAILDPTVDDVDSYQPPEQSANPRDVIYNSARQEKISRAEEFSVIKRALDKNTVIIADAPNYIKGFRYQLFCEAKAAGTRSVVVHTAAREDESTAWNDSRLKAWKWQFEDPQNPDQHSSVAQISGPKIGSNILGDLNPESHTAIYGDKVLDSVTRSRSSSTGAAASDDDGVKSPSQQYHRHDDSMTLKSLYVTDQPVTTLAAEPEPPQRGQGRDLSPQRHTLPPSDPPSQQSSLPYAPATLKSLLMRYEPPSPFTRWDTPLFTVPSTDPHPPYDQIWDALFPSPPKQNSKKVLAKEKAASQKEAQSNLQTPTFHSSNTPDDAVAAVRQHAATVLPGATTPDALQTLESTTGEIAKAILSAARTSGCADGAGGEITITLTVPASVSGTIASNGDEKEDLDLHIDVPEGLMLSQPVLQRLRRKYTQLQKGGIAHGQGYTRGRRAVAEGFVRFLEAEWDASV